MAVYLGNTRVQVSIPQKNDNNDYLCFEADEAGSTVSISCLTSTVMPNEFEYSRDKSIWTDWGDGSQAVTLQDVGDKMWIRSKYEDRGFSINGKNRSFTLSGSIKASGSLKSLCSKTCNFSNMLNTEHFSRIFEGNAALKSLPEFPDLGAANSAAYESALKNCTGLVDASNLKLNISSTGWGCLRAMFYGCSNIEVGPQMSFKLTGSYNQQTDSMFSLCTKLKSLKFTSNVVGKYAFMNCSSLRIIDMTGCTEVPLLANVNAFNQLPSGYRVVVPDELYTDWCNATNWAAVATHITTVSQLGSVTSFNEQRATMTNYTDYCTKLEGGLFYNNNTNLSVYLPNATTIDANTFNWSGLVYGYFPKVSTFATSFNSLRRCTELEFPALTAITGVSNFSSSYYLSSITIGDSSSTTVCKLANANAFLNVGTKSTAGTYTVYVPDNLYDNYLTATNWTSIASHIKKQSEK